MARQEMLITLVRAAQHLLENNVSHLLPGIGEGWGPLPKLGFVQVPTGRRNYSEWIWAASRILTINATKKQKQRLTLDQFFCHGVAVGHRGSGKSHNGCRYDGTERHLQAPQQTIAADPGAGHLHG